MREWTLAMNQAGREQGRLNDFAVLVNHISENYPFVELVASQNGVDYIKLAVTVFDELAEVARYDVTPLFFNNFLTEQYLSILGGFGGLRLTGEPRAMHNWLTQPYFFNYYDWRFNDDRLYVPVLDGNITSKVLTEGILYLHINSFLPKGYEPVNRNPFWYFCFDMDKHDLKSLFDNLYDIDDLIIDIRGIGSGFRDYFIPQILAQYLDEPIYMRYYAFHSEGRFSSRVSYAFRTWYGLEDEPTCRSSLEQDFIYDLPEILIQGFPVEIAVQPLRYTTFEGRIWLLTDSANFSGPNFAYLQMAQDAGFTIVYEENTKSVGWATSFIHLPHSGLSVRFNPLYFTDDTGRSFEETGAFYDYRLAYISDDFSEVLAVIKQFQPYI